MCMHPHSAQHINLEIRFKICSARINTVLKMVEMTVVEALRYQGTYERMIGVSNRTPESQTASYIGTYLLVAVAP